MIYLFKTGENISIVYNEKYISEEKQAQATVVIETLPKDLEPKLGFDSVININDETMDVSYVYVAKTNSEQIIKLNKLVEDGILTQEQADELK